MPNKSYRIEEKLVLVLFLSVGILGIILGFEIGNPLNQSVGPSIFPILLSVVIAACAIIEICPVFLRRPRKNNDATINVQLIKEMVLMAVILFAGIGLWVFVGYVPAMICALLSVIMYDYEKKMIKGFAYAAGVSLVMWGLLFKILGLS